MGDQQSRQHRPFPHRSRSSRVRGVASGIAERAAVDYGAFEKNLDDIKEYRRFAVFPTREIGERAVLPLLFVFAAPPTTITVGEVLRIYFGLADVTARERYESEIRTRLVKSYASRLALTDSALSDAERNERATQLANGLLNRKTLDLERFVTDDSQYLERAVLEVERCARHGTRRPSLHLRGLRQP